MSSIINTNIASLNAQRNLNASQGSLQTTLQRLSSGLRINTAKDDAAGLAISSRFTTQINGLDQAVRNASDGISLAQTAEGSLGTISENLQRIRTLAVQSANATNSASDRAALDQEVQQRIAEIDRTATQTTFNGLKVLDGTFGTANFQVGANVGETIGISLTQGVRANQIGQIATATGGRVTSTALTAGSLTIAVGTGSAIAVGASVAGASPGQTTDSAYSKVQAINAASVPGLTATATNTVTGAFTTTSAVAADTYGLKINGIDVYAAYDLNANGALTGGAVAAQINLFSTQTGVGASFDSGTGNITLSAADGRNIVAKETLGGAATGGIADAVADQTAGGVTTRGTISLTAASNITLTGNTPIGHSNVIALDSTTLTSVNVNSVSNANTAISRIDAALTAVSALRSTLGAIQNRFESTIANLSSSVENQTAARSRILDADFASETANLSRSQILQQAGTAVLAQANVQPQSVLKLLSG